MGLLEKVVGALSENPKETAYILFGVLVVGSIGGGFWIYTLQTQLSEQESISNQRIQLIEERSKSAIASIQQDRIAMSSRLEALERSVEGLSGLLKENSEFFQTLLSANTLEEGTVTSLRKIVEDLETQTEVLPKNWTGG